MCQQFFAAVDGATFDFDVFSWSYRYDSITIDGNLKWQNQLNEYNKAFFDICDGIFVNYTWKVLLIFPWNVYAKMMFDQFPLSLVNLLCTMQEDYPRLSAAVASDRKFDVYMGIDVFGRNTYGGGQWNVRGL